MFQGFAELISILGTQKIQINAEVPGGLGVRNISGICLIYFDFSDPLNTIEGSLHRLLGRLKYDQIWYTVRTPQGGGAGGGGATIIFVS